MPDAASQPVVGGLPSGWAQSTYDPEAFAAEQRRFAHCLDVPRPGGRCRARRRLVPGGHRRSLRLRPAYQRQLRGFENRCAHRFFPLRVTDKGNGPIVCGFHHWRYDGDGRAQGIPACKDVFGVVSRELDIGLTPVELVFAAL
jgi:nitrite reductase/ring-hydroxylating ferredoxin subunit